MASIEKRGKNSYRLIVEAGYDGQNKRLKRSRAIKVDEKLTPKKLKEYLELELVKFKMEVEAGEYIAPEKMTFSAFAEEWREKFAEKELSPSTLKNDLNRLNKHIMPVFGHLRLDQIKTMHIVNFINNLRSNDKEIKRSENTILNVYKVLKSILSCAKEWRLITTNPIDGVKRPRQEKKKMKYLDAKEAQEVITALYNEPTVWRLYFLGAMLGGFRRGELLALEWPDVNFEDNTLFIHKSISLTRNGEAIVKKPKTDESEGIVDMPDWYMRELKMYYKERQKERWNLGDKWQGGDKQYVFHSGLGKPYHYTTPTGTWNKFIKRHKLKHVRLHDLRHTAATLLIEAGVDLKIIQERLRHSKYQTTADLYAHVTKKVSKETASKLDKFDPRMLKTEERIRPQK